MSELNAAERPNGTRKTIVELDNVNVIGDLARVISLQRKTEVPSAKEGRD